MIYNNIKRSLEEKRMKKKSSEWHHVFLKANILLILIFGLVSTSPHAVGLGNHFAPILSFFQHYF